MIPAGYLLKRVTPPAGWFDVPAVEEICSVSDCANEDVVDVQKAWAHNDLGVANTPEVLWRLVEAEGQDASNAQLFYYEAYEREMESDGWSFDPSRWKPLDRMPTGDPSTASPPASAQLLGYDIVVFGDFLEHSPLSCNGVATILPVNRYCLLATLEEAVSAIENGAFGDGCEGGSYTIFAVHRVS